jgi:hypothetical protein
LQIDCAGGYLDFRPKIRPAGDGILKAAGRAKESMKNLPRDGCRKSSAEDFDFPRLSAGSALLQIITENVKQTGDRHYCDNSKIWATTKSVDDLKPRIYTPRHRSLTDIKRWRGL